MVSPAAYLKLFTAPGMSPFNSNGFDLFRHETIEVEQSDDPDRPIRITEVVRRRPAQPKGTSSPRTSSSCTMSAGLGGFTFTGSS